MSHRPMRSSHHIVNTSLFLCVAQIQLYPVCPAICICLCSTGTGPGPVPSIHSSGLNRSFVLPFAERVMFYLCTTTFLFSLKTVFQISELNLVWWKVKTFVPFHIFPRTCLYILSEFSCFLFLLLFFCILSLYSFFFSLWRSSQCRGKRSIR